MHSADNVSEAPQSEVEYITSLFIGPVILAFAFGGWTYRRVRELFGARSYEAPTPPPHTGQTFDEDDIEDDDNKSAAA